MLFFINLILLQIEVSDNFVGGLVQRTSVCVQVYHASSNDFCPQFSMSAFSTEVREDAAVGSTLLSVMATDEDRGLQGLVSYALTGQIVSSTLLIPKSH